MGIRTSVGRETGRGQFNAPNDVNLVKHLLNLVYPHASLSENGLMDEATIGWIEEFQRDVVGLREPDGYISPRGRTWRALMAATSDSRYAMLVDQCVIRPRYQHMRTAYDAYRVDSAPCKAGVTNQCAVRMSIAMVRSGLDFLGFANQRRVHRGRRSCRITIPHVLGANELARYLTQILGQPRRFSRAQAEGAQQTLSGQRGVIYFDNCFTRRGQTRKVGDHIDLWTGSQYYNQIIRVGAGGDAGAEARLFRLADGGVWFWPLS